ncbi:MAG: efflux RND transporter periplasmic adaptor subunit [Venatoribacter sp.]
MTDNLFNPPKKQRLAVALSVLMASLFVGYGLWLSYRPQPGFVQGMADADSLKVSAKIGARLAELYVKEGERVTLGQALFRLDSPEVEAKYAQAKAAVDAAEAQANKAQDGARSEQIRAAEANYERAKTSSDLARITADRLNGLFQDGVVSRQNRDEALAQAQAAQALTAAAKAQLDEAQSGARKQDKDAANAQVRQAQAVLAEVKAARAETLGMAPASGEVAKRLADVGELVPAGYPVFTLVDIDNMWVSMALREEQFLGMKIGAQIQADVPALGLSNVAFEVFYISPAADFATWRATRQSAGYDVKSFEVRSRPVTKLDGFRPGMSVLFHWPVQ